MIEYEEQQHIYIHTDNTTQQYVGGFFLGGGGVVSKANWFDHDSNTRSSLVKIRKLKYKYPAFL